jgi:deoxyxylulose-5-phosphate synthase
MTKISWAFLLSAIFAAFKASFLGDMGIDYPFPIDSTNKKAILRILKIAPNSKHFHFCSYIVTIPF